MLFINSLSFCEYWWVPWLLPLLLSLLTIWFFREHWKSKNGILEDTNLRLKNHVASLENDNKKCAQEKSILRDELTLSQVKERDLAYKLKLQSEAGDVNTGITNLDENIIESLNARINELELELDSFKSTNTQLQSELLACQEKNSTMTSSIESATLDLSSSGDNDSTGDDLALGITASQSVDKFAILKEDNLQLIEGIGPKMESILHENGIVSWSVLASKSHAELKAILDKYGDRYRIIDPSEWAAQAALASDRNWNGLINFQKDDGSESKAEKIFIKLGILKAYKLNDLKIVEGIGPKIETLLNNAGIDTWMKLSEAKVSDLQEILDQAGSRYSLADPETWPKQAEFAVKEQWDALEEYQDFLKGGRSPS